MLAMGEPNMARAQEHRCAMLYVCNVHVPAGGHRDAECMHAPGTNPACFSSSKEKRRDKNVYQQVRCDKCAINAHAFRAHQSVTATRAKV